MATDLTNQAEAAIHGFYRASDALESLGKLYETTHAAVDKYQPGPRVVDVTQNILDMAVQKVVERLSWRLLQESDATPASVGLPELLDLCIDGIAHKYLIVSAAYKVLEDVMEAQTISTCEKMWDLVEERKDKLSTRDIHSETGRPTKAALCLLRMCNALLRRVSKTHNSVFCGRILVFLSFTFALSERSAVNLTGKPNVSNSTTFIDEEAFKAAEAAEEVAAATAVQLDKDSTTDGVPIDYNLYRTFWDLQRFCREHNLAIKSVDDWEKFNEELNTVLSAFEGNAFSPDDLERTRDLLTSATSSTISGDTDEEMSSPTTAQDHFFQPKYLTNSRLFRLQLRDPILRECMLTQFLILLNHLTKAKQPDGCKTPKSRLQELSDRVVKLIRETPPSGKRFSEMLDLVLERERNWVKWKQEKCPSYERSPPPQEAPMPKKRRMGDMPALSSRAPLPKRGKQQDSGDSSLMEQILTESSKPSAILERIRGQDRATAVPIEKFTERFAEAWDPENGIEEAYWPDKDKMFCWRTLRMAMKTNVVHMHLAASSTGAVVKAILGLPAATPAKETPEQGENATAKEEADRMKQEAAKHQKPHRPQPISGSTRDKHGFLVGHSAEHIEINPQSIRSPTGMAWRPLLATVVNWSVWGFMLLLVMSQFLGIGWNAMESSEHFLFGRSPDNPPTPIPGTNDEPYTDRSLVCMPRGRSYVPMQISEVLANPRYSQVVDTTGTSTSGFRMCRREQIGLDDSAVLHYQHVCEHIDQTLDVIQESCELLGYNITREELRIVGDITSDTTYTTPRALPIVIIPFWDNAFNAHFVIPGWDGMACDFRLDGTFRLPTEKTAVFRGVPRSVRESKTVQWIGVPGGVWRNGWYEDGTGQRWSSHMVTTDLSNVYGLQTRRFDLLRNVEIDCEAQKSLRECIDFLSLESWGQQCVSAAVVKRCNQLFISNGTHFGFFLFDADQQRTVTNTYSLETLISNVSTVQLLFRWWVSMMVMANSYRRGVAPWQTAGIGILSSSRTFNLLPVILLPRLKMIMAAFWTIGCQFEGQQRAMSDAWFAMYPAMCELLLLYYSLLNFIAKVTYRRMSDAWFGPTLLALALMHRSRKELANPTWLGVDGRVATVVSSDEFDSLRVIDMLTPSIAFRLNGNIALVFYAKIILLALNLVPLVLSENMTKAGRTYRLCEACGIEQTLALRASNIGGLGRSPVYAIHDVHVQSSPRRPRGSIQPASDSIRTAIMPFKSNDTAGEERTPVAVTVGPSSDSTKKTFVLVAYEVNRLGYLIFGERFLISFDDWFILTSLSPLRVIDKLWNHRVIVFDVTKTGDGRFAVERKSRICRLDDKDLLAIPWYDVVVCAFP